MSSLSVLNGRISALSSRLLTENQINQMVGAKDAEQAFNLLSELFYAEYLKEGTTVQDFYKVLNQGLLDTKKLIDNELTTSSQRVFLWGKFDLNNIRRLLKNILLEPESENLDFSIKNGFSFFGDISEEKIKSIALEGFSTECDYETFWLEVIQQAKVIFSQENNFQAVDFFLDQSFFNLLEKNITNEKLQDYFDFTVSNTNFKTLVRHLALFDSPLDSQAWISQDNMTFDRVSDLKSIEQMEGIFHNQDHRQILSKISNQEPATALNLLEKEIEKINLLYLNDNSLGEESLLVVIHYLEQRLNNAHTLKFIIFAKMNNLTEEEIYKILEK